FGALPHPNRLRFARRFDLPARGEVEATERSGVASGGAGSDLGGQKEGVAASAANRTAKVADEGHAASPLRRAKARARPMRGSSFFSSGPSPRPVSASRNGWNRARPLMPVASATCFVQTPQVASSHGSGGSRSAA